ncbi:MAG TPA: ribonucleoside-triphosphate reductase, adenosylcobalamin-dependent [Jatrophihabitans sp.]|nr:ribonucleoside-triphosphate reductase, adenosylcobalamin-dependent [Jatrophihabitans sp.]
MTPFGPTGKVVYERTYSRKHPDGSQEIWPETVERVARGNLALVHGADMATWPAEAITEYELLRDYMSDFRIIPAGRHLWASGVKGRQYLFNCHVAGWGEKLSRHFEFTFLRLMEGGGVGANYSSRFLEGYGSPRRGLAVHIVCDPNHPDYEALLPYLSSDYDSDWTGSFEVEDSREGWADALVDLIDTYMTDDEVKHSNRVYDVSRVRGKGSRLKTFGGIASGPAPFAKMLHDIAAVLNGPSGRWLSARSHLRPDEAMLIDHAIAECVVSGGNRRSARMAIVEWDDPHIFEFLGCKKDTGQHWTTNISVAIDNRFAELVHAEIADGLEGEDLNDWAQAQAVHREVVTGMLTNGEPGYWNQELSNLGEPNPVIATNPCGEIALEAWENCNLGHVNMDAFAPRALGDEVDIDGLVQAHELMTRFLIRATYGDVNDPGQADKLARNRRIGVGHMGVQGFWAKLGIRYSDVPKRSSGSGADELLQRLYGVVRNVARAYAFELRIPEPVKVTTVAPTGSVAKLPGVSEGIHPIFARYFNRRVRFSIADPHQAETVLRAQADGYTVEVDRYDTSGNTMIVVYPTKDALVEQVEALGYPANTVQSADEISVEDMLSFQLLYQRFWADNAVSFTVNVPAEPHQNAALQAGALAAPAPTEERLHEVAHTLSHFLGGLKGTTLMVDGTRPQAPYERITQAEYELSQLGTVADGIDEECANGACPVR